MVQILYGFFENTIDITNICLSQFKNNDTLIIRYTDLNNNIDFPQSFDEREKILFVIINGNICEYSINYVIKINIHDDSVVVEKEIKILYGIYEKRTVDVTDFCFTQLRQQNVITIPECNFTKDTYFSDPLYGVFKNMYLINNGIICTYQQQCTIKINTYDFKVTTEITDKVLSIPHGFDVKDSFKILYGNYDNLVDVTHKCFSKLENTDIIIPYGDINRDSYFSCPLEGKAKSVFIVKYGIIDEYQTQYNIKINIKDFTVVTQAVFRILYGVDGNLADVTYICLSKLNNDGIITIPYSVYNKSLYFYDPLDDVKKSVFLVNGTSVQEYDSECSIKINIIDNSVITETPQVKIFYGCYGMTFDVTDICFRKLKNKINIITIPYGDTVRNSYFNDYLVGKKKSIFIIHNGIFHHYDYDYVIRIHLGDKIKITSVKVLSILYYKLLIRNY